MRLNSHFLDKGIKNRSCVMSTGDIKYSEILKNNMFAPQIVECLKTDTTEYLIIERLANMNSAVDKTTIIRDVTGVIGKLRCIGAIDE